MSDPKVALRISSGKGSQGNLINMASVFDPEIDPRSYVADVDFISDDPKEKIEYSFLTHPYLNDKATLTVYTKRFFFFRSLKLEMAVSPLTGRFEITRSKLKLGNRVLVEVTLGDYKLRPTPMGI